MLTKNQLDTWEAFKDLNTFRRAIRKFSADPIPEEDIRALLGEATLAPSSGNLHPYQLHWVREPELKSKIAAACNGQRAAATATDIIVVAANPGFGRKTAIDQLDYIEASPKLGVASKDYHRKQTEIFQKVLGIDMMVHTKVEELLRTDEPFAGNLKVAGMTFEADVVFPVFGAKPVLPPSRMRKRHLCGVWTLMVGCGHMVMKKFSRLAMRPKMETR